MNTFQSPGYVNWRQMELFVTFIFVRAARNHYIFPTRKAALKPLLQAQKLFRLSFLTIIKPL